MAKKHDKPLAADDAHASDANASDANASDAPENSDATVHAENAGTTNAAPITVTFDAAVTDASVTVTARTDGAVVNVSTFDRCPEPNGTPCAGVLEPLGQWRNGGPWWHCRTCGYGEVRHERND